MQLNIKIDLDNSAYEDLGWELGKNLDWIVSEIGLGSTKGKVKDTNGNTTGYWTLQEEEEPNEFIRKHFKFIHVGD